MPTAKQRADLPEFGKPPVTEVLLSIQFATLDRMRTHLFGLLWNEFRREYPVVSEQPPLTPVFEIFGGEREASRSFTFEARFAPLTPRFWFESDDGVHLLQIQQDRLIHNWRKRNEDAIYPRYEALLGRFIGDIDRVQHFLAREDLGTLSPNQCEVAYINTIELPGRADPHINLDRVTPLWGGWRGPPGVAELENATVQARAVIDEGGTPIGRLYVNITPVILLSEARPAVQVELVARGRPLSASIDDAIRLLNVERSAIVRTFEKITAPELHTIWEMANANS